MPLYNPPVAHPDLATHDGLGLATDAELSTHAADTTSVHGIADTSLLSTTSHDHDADYEASGAVATHAGLADPHTGYRLESADHSHASAGLQGGTVAHSVLTGTTADDHHAQAHAIGGADHTGTLAHSATSGITANDHHNQAHTLVGADHTASGLTIGHVLTASSATAFGFAAPASPSLSSASAFATAETTLSAATYADITGCSVSLAAGTWMVYGHVVARAVNAIIQVFVAITHSDNTVISESAISRPASGTANLNSPIAVSWFALVSPGSTTTYKLRGARGLTTHTGSWIAMDGTGFNTTNHATNNSDKGTGIFAIKIA